MKFIQVECRLGCLGEINIKSCNSIVLSVSLCVFRRRWRAVLCCWCSAPLSDSFTCRTSAHRALCYVGLARWFLVLCPIMQHVLAEVGVFLCKIKLPQRGGESWCAVCVCLEKLVCWKWNFTQVAHEVCGVMCWRRWLPRWSRGEENSCL